MIFVILFYSFLSFAISVPIIMNGKDVSGSRFRPSLFLSSALCPHCPPQTLGSYPLFVQDCANQCQVCAAGLEGLASAPHISALSCGSVTAVGNLFANQKEKEWDSFTQDSNCTSTAQVARFSAGVSHQKFVRQVSGKL